MGWTKIKGIGQLSIFFVRLEIVVGFKVGIRVCGLRKGPRVGWEDVMGEEDEGNEEQLASFSTRVVGYAGRLGRASTFYTQSPE